MRGEAASLSLSLFSGKMGVIILCPGVVPVNQMGKQSRKRSGNYKESGVCVTGLALELLLSHSP